MPFDGSFEHRHFNNHEILQEHLSSLEHLYKLFVSLVRDVNIKGVNATYSMFPQEYSDSRITEDSLHEKSRLFLTRSAAERTMWKKKGRVLEVGVASGDHAISLITTTQAIAYVGIDINFSQLSENTKAEFDNYSKTCDIRLIRQDSLKALENLMAQSEEFDSIYIDASHWHRYVSQELLVCSKLVTKHGRIVLNDYVQWFVGSMEPCGVIRAVNEYLISNKEWCIDYFAINENDISLVRR